MDRAAFDAFCAPLPGAAHVIQWGGASVWKIGEGGPVFAIHSRWGDGEGVVLKPSEMAREVWRGHPGVNPAPYLGSKGWLKIDDGAMGRSDLEALIAASHGINAAKLSRKARASLGL